MATENLEKLKRENHFYHATPIRNAESIFAHGLKVEYGRFLKDDKRYLCLSESPSIAQSMARMSKAEIRHTKNNTIAIFGFNWELLDHSFIDFVDEDPRLDGGIITYKDFSPKGIDQLIITNALQEIQTFHQKCSCRTPPIDLYIL